MELDEQEFLKPFLGVAPNQFNFLLHPKPGSNKLLVVFSQSRKLALSNLKFNHNVLFLTDLRSTYYITHMPHLAKALVAVCKPFEAVLFTGGSKGGFGALAAAGVCARLDPKRHWRALAFSPITSLKEGTSSDQYPSAQGVRRRAQSSAGIAKRLEQYGDVGPLIRNVRNLSAIVVYPIKHAADAAAAMAVSAPNVRLYPLHIALHGTMYAFLNQRRRPEDNANKLKVLYRHAEDEDMRAAGLLKVTEIAADIHGMNWLPSFDEIIEEGFNMKGPPPLPTPVLSPELAERQRKRAQGSRLLSVAAPYLDLVSEAMLLQTIKAINEIDAQKEGAGLSAAVASTVRRRLEEGEPGPGFAAALLAMQRWPKNAEFPELAARALDALGATDRAEAMRRQAEGLAAADAARLADLAKRRAELIAGKRAAAAAETAERREKRAQRSRLFRVAEPYADFLSETTLLQTIKAVNEIDAQEPPALRASAVAAAARRRLEAGEPASGLATALMAMHRWPKTAEFPTLAASALEALGAGDHAASMRTKAQAIEEAAAARLAEVVGRRAEAVAQKRLATAAEVAERREKRTKDSRLFKVAEPYADLLEEGALLRTVRIAFMIDAREAAEDRSKAAAAEAERFLEEGKPGGCLAMALFAMHRWPKAAAFPKLAANALTALGAAERAEAMARRAQALEDAAPRATPDSDVRDALAPARTDAMELSGAK
jgi:hypothetical protein